MRKICSFFCILFFAVASSQAQQEPRPLDYAKLDAYFEQALKAWNIPGMAIGIIENDSLVFAKGYGVTDVNTGEKVNANTLFCIASNSKSFTSAAVATLVDAKKVNWDDKVVNHLPYFRTYDPYVTANFTVRDLLCHRSGLATFSGDLIWYGSTHSREEVIKRSAMLKPVYGFRAHYGYSNIHFLTAGQVVQALSGKPWEQYVKEKFLQPLGMNRTATSVTELKGMSNVAQPHNEVDGKLVKIPFVNWDNIAPAGALISSVNDMSRWLRLQLNQGTLEGKNYFSKATSWEMWSMQTPEALNPGSKKTFPSKHFDGYGLGWALNDYKGYKVVSHGGGYDGMISQTAMIPDLKFGFVILTNSNNYLPAALYLQLLDQYLYTEDKDWSQAYLDFVKQRDESKKEEAQKEEAARLKNTKPTLELKAYEGTYGGAMYGDITVKLENGRLKLKFVQTPLFEGELVHWQHDVFTIKLDKVPSLPQGKVQFLLNAAGEVKEAMVDIPNPDFDFTELEFKRKK